MKSSASLFIILHSVCCWLRSFVITCCANRTCYCKISKIKRSFFPLHFAPFFNKLGKKPVGGSKKLKITFFSPYRAMSAVPWSLRFCRLFHLIHLYNNQGIFRTYSSPGHHVTISVWDGLKTFNMAYGWQNFTSISGSFGIKI